MATDITTAILETLLQFLTDELQTQYPTSDPLRAKKVEYAPLQEDPTQDACFVVLQPAKEHTRDLDQRPEFQEIGPLNTRWINRFEVTGWTKRQTTKANAYAHTGGFMTRVLSCLLTHFDLDGVSSDDGEMVTGCSKYLVDRQDFHILGGPSQFYGRYTIQVHYFSERPQP